MPETQKEQIVRMLREAAAEGRAVCNQQFLREYLYPFRNRISELRKEGMIIQTEPCKEPAHRHVRTQWRYRLIAAEPHQGQLI